MEFTFGGMPPKPLTITIDLTKDETDVLGADAERLTQYLVAILRTLHTLRTTGTLSTDDATYALDATRRLEARIDGLTDAIIRDWAGSIGDLAHAMRAMAVTRVPRSTAQSRLKTVKENPASEFEQWAKTIPQD